MHIITLLTPLMALIPLLSFANPLPNLLNPRQTTCTAYTIINTRGTGERQGESSGFVTINNNVERAIPGGTVYNTVYPAGFSQNSAAGTRDILRQMDATLARDAGHCFILEGYSQGAAATVNALEQITAGDAKFTATKGVFLIGNPMHNRGLACNVDVNGGTTTLNVDGISARLGRIPDRWISKTLDVCNRGDGVCDTTNGRGINAAHLVYPRSSATQTLGTNFILARLRGQ